MTDWDAQYLGSDLPNPTKHLHTLSDEDIDRIASAIVWAATLVAVAVTLIPALALYQAYAH